MPSSIPRMLRRPAALAAFALAALGVAPAAHAAVFTFDTDPFAGSNALTQPGRQVVGNEISIPVFDFAADVLAFNTSVFSAVGPLAVFNGIDTDIPAGGGSNFIVLRSFDGDGNPGNGNQLNAGTAANLIAAAITAPDPVAGFFVYFNSGLDLARLVYSTDLGSNQADLKVLARFNGIAGAAGRDAMSLFTAGNVASVPEPSSWAMLIAGFGLVGAMARRRGAAHVVA